MGQSVIDSFRFGDSYRNSELCELVDADLLNNTDKSTTDIVVGVMLTWSVRSHQPLLNKQHVRFPLATAAIKGEG